METGSAGSMEGTGRGTGRPCRDARRGASQHGLRSMVDKVGREGFKTLDGDWVVMATGGTRMEKVLVIRERRAWEEDAEPRMRSEGGSPRLIELRQDCDEQGQGQGQIRYPDTSVFPIRKY